MIQMLTNGILKTDAVSSDFPIRKRQRFKQLSKLSYCTFRIS